MWRSVASNAITFLIVAIFLVSGVVLWGQRQYTEAGPLDEAICVRVERGSNFSRVSESLAADGAITNAQIFRVGVDYSDKTTDLKAGAYLVPPHASMEQIVDIVTKGGASTCGTEVVYRVGVNALVGEVRELDPATGKFSEVAEYYPGTDAEVPAEVTRVKEMSDTRYRIALAEGVTSWQIVDSLKKVDILAGEVAAVPAEGTLAPDSYEVTKGEDRSAILGRMETLQASRVAEAWANRADDIQVSTPEEMVVLASIIEKETGIAQERPWVSSVFTNRLKQGVPLQTDPTVIYGITKGEGVLGRGLRQSELRRETPWNTYVIRGLPPTPIANPGLESLMAAVNPAQTDYMFFVADGTGGHAFAATLAEHNANVAKWRKIEAERAKSQ
ncbi:endolytic transglycosylase MltG [Donghicola sp. C2-DW-16]|uniref:Endolytic murein transglycosylase n=1 Tax=Donghicola mangrovi TaxID=2729614 RepID=A0A850Q1C0_9RHOB|nr:endolytic transglycosylase MltG [Donghicola mangrovi]NVO22813.1 endolytic transglycosylase MltG [Donghicola mangrovi]NVO27760.1 endolytic transglycosylase MltG [Donghicola mangrovi]